MYLASVRIENFRRFGSGSDALEVSLGRGLTALVGENESGKTAVIDALRLALGTTDQEWQRLADTDFHGSGSSEEIKVVCKFEGLTTSDHGALLEFLTYEDDGPVLYVNWNVKDTGELRRGRPYRRQELRSGKDAVGLPIPADVRDRFLSATYMRPLRDAEKSLSAGRGSRLSQILHHTSEVTESGVPFNPEGEVDPNKLNVLGIGDFANFLLKNQDGVARARAAVDEHLDRLSLTGEAVTSSIGVSGETAADRIRLRLLLEKLDISLEGLGKRGLGANNLLYIACELLLLAQEEAGSRLLLIEEPEVHLDTQSQLQLMSSLQEQAEAQGVQIIITTHSPNLASTIPVENLVMVRGGRAFSMAQGQTNLEPSDYRFLERFLDVTKANLFFARGVMIVEGDAENLLVPTLAKLIGRDFTKHGVSIVNVGGVGLRRYARVFQRSGEAGESEGGWLDIRVACVTDLDIMPACAGEITGKSLPKKADFEEEGLTQRRADLEAKASGQCVVTFVADEWTLEYDLAFFGLAEDVFVAAQLAKKETALDQTGIGVETESAREAFQVLKSEVDEANEQGTLAGCTPEEMLASRVYAQFTTGSKASKAVAAQYLAELVEERCSGEDFTGDDLRGMLPPYLTAAIDHVTGAEGQSGGSPNGSEP